MKAAKKAIELEWETIEILVRMIERLSVPMTDEARKMLDEVKKARDEGLAELEKPLETRSIACCLPCGNEGDACLDCSRVASDNWRPRHEEAARG